MSPQKRNFIKGLSRIGTDFLAALSAWGMAYLLRPIADLIPGIDFPFTEGNLPPLEDFQIFTIWSSIAFVFILAQLRLYSSYPKPHYLSFAIVRELVVGVAFWILMMIAIYSLVFHELFFSRIMLLHAALFSIIFAILFRLILFWLWEKIFLEKRKALVKGSLEEYELLQERLQNSSFLLTDKDEEQFADVFFFEASHTAEQLRTMREWCAEYGKTLFLIPAYASEFWGHASFEMIRGVPMVCATPTPPKYWWFFGKRIFDIIFSLFFLILLFPLFLIVAFAIVWESEGPVFYVSKRVGKNGVLFSMIKFRSMFIDAEKRKEELLALSHRDGPLFKIKNDPRITKVGKFLRKTSIDELPNFINVLLGDMSIIGPRPHLPNEVAKYEPSQKRVLSVRPGISGLAQVSGRSDLSFEQEMILETYYTENMGVWLDMKIFFKTPFVLLGGKGAD